MHPTAKKISEEVNMKCHRRNTMVQLSAPYINPGCHRLTDGQTTVWCQ